MEISVHFCYRLGWLTNQWPDVYSQVNMCDGMSKKHDSEGQNLNDFNRNIDEER